MNARSGILLVLVVITSVLLIGGSIGATGGTPLWDTHAYWQAALRLREGLPLYDPSLQPDSNVIYRYAPWFAYAWVPLTYLPPALVLAAWWTALAIAWGASLYGLRDAPITALLFAALTFHGLWVGNVQSLMVLPLIYRHRYRDGPIWIALAASLKATPILFVLVYVGRRQWGKVALAIGVSAFLVSHGLLFDLDGYPVSSGAEASLFGIHPIAWAAIGFASAMTAFDVAGGRFAGLAAGTAALVTLPRLLLYDVSFLLVGTVHRGIDRRSRMMRS